MKKILCFIILLIPIFAYADNTKDAVMALKKMEARVQSGISYRDYGNALADAKFPVNLFMESIEVKKNPGHSRPVPAAISLRQLAATLADRSPRPAPRCRGAPGSGPAGPRSAPAGIKPAPPTPIAVQKVELQGDDPWNPQWDVLIEENLPPELLSAAAFNDPLVDRTHTGRYRLDRAVEILRPCLRIKGAWL